MMKIGAQMFTVREYCRTLDGFAETLAKLADMGFKVVQVSGTCPYEGEWLDEQLKKNGLTCALTHNPYDKLMNDPLSVIENHRKFSCKNIGCGGKKTSMEEFIEIVRPSVKAVNEAGFKFFYHNHNGEFYKTDGKNDMERLAEAFTPEEMNFTLDTYWVHVAGADPIQWMRKFKDRLHCIHLKDAELYKSEKGYELRYAPVGSGNMNFEGILSAADEFGVEYGLIEQDDCYGRDPFECLKESLAYLRAKGYKD